LDRRRFLASSVAASGLVFTSDMLTKEVFARDGLSREGGAEAPAAQGREYYQLRRYQLQSGAEPKLVESYFSDALIPAAGRMGLGPVGAFRLEYGPETPAYYLLLTGRAVEDLAMLDLRLAQDATFLKAAEPFWNAPAATPAYVRMESSLMAAFEGWPRLTPPASSATKGKRIFQLRTYESPSDQDHVRKVEMFHKGEFEIFVKAGAHPVFFGDTLVGARMPNLTYMLSFAGMPEMEAAWAAFRDAPAWKALSAMPRYAYEAIVSNITNLLLSPLECSQV
jgi:NIPSNAP